MARPQASGWMWNEERTRQLADRIRLDHTCAQIAAWFNEHFQEAVPGLALTRDSILKAVRSKTVIGLFSSLYGEAETEALVARIRRPRGRPKGAKDKSPRASSGRATRRSPRSSVALHRAGNVLGYSRS